MLYAMVKSVVQTQATVFETFSTILGARRIQKPTFHSCCEVLLTLYLFTKCIFYFRYYAIVHPMKAKYICTISQAKKIILTTWIASIVLALPNFLIQVRVTGTFGLFFNNIL